MGEQMTDKKQETSLWGKFNNWSKENKKELYGIGFSGMMSGLGSVLSSNQLRSNTRNTLYNINENSRIQTKNLTGIMSNNALSYLKNGVGISGSAIDVINTNATNGLNEINNQVYNETSQLINNLRDYRNQAGLSLLSTAGTIGGLFL